ncbi:MAG TPA: Gfo/Idh/MocA family oxidoreductase [Armatimonadaceae bacterium]|nr:Gfo/Idh/MocA family oxidoreductase [Armatimonadaceae bacterium]
MATPVRIGLIGVGGMARAHINQLSRIPDVKITALCDIKPEQLERAKKQFPDFLTDCFETADYHELLAREDVDAVEIATPHTLHFDQAMDAIKAKKHVLVEKPMVCTVEHAKTLLGALEGYDKVFALAYQRHAQGTYVYMREKIASGELGQVQFVNALLSQSWKKGTAGSWRQELALSGGGQLNDSGSHILDVIMWMTGLTVADVSAFIDNSGTEVDQNSALAVKFTNGGQGVISVLGDTCVGWHEDITIWCEKGAFFLRNGKLEFCSEKNVRTTIDGETLPPGRSIDEDFIGVIRGEYAAPAAPPLCGLKTIELTEAAWKSGAQNGQPVKMN